MSLREIKVNYRRMDNTGNGVMNMGFSVWLTICIFLGLWLWSSITKRRRNFHNNLHVIEEGLRRMQADIETRQRENSMGCVEDVEDISEFLKKFYEEGNNNQEVWIFFVNKSTSLRHFFIGGRVDRILNHFNFLQK